MISMCLLVLGCSLLGWLSSTQEAHSPDGKNEIRFAKGVVEISRGGKPVLKCPAALDVKGAQAQIEVKACNQGVAYRWVLKGTGEATIVSETADLIFPTAQETVWLQKNNGAWGGDPFQCSWENAACEHAVKDLASSEEELYFAPLTFARQDFACAVTETDLHDYAGWNFRRDEKNDNVLKGIFARYPLDYITDNWGATRQTKSFRRLRYERVIKRADYVVKTSAERTLPWRVFMLADNPVGLLGNTLVRDLASPARVADTSWIKPGKVMWEWWNNWNLKNVNFAPGVNTQTYKAYIDFASQTGVEYIIMDEGWSKTLNIWEVIPAIDLPELVRYGNEKKVGIILWMAWGQIHRDEERVVKHFKEMGIKGFKVDFMDRDDAQCVAALEKFAEVCAAHQMLVDYHGMYKPCGMDQAYPNVVNFEGVRGLETMKWGGLDMIENDASIPYVRGLAGMMDYTPAAMDNYAKGLYKPRKHEPGSLGTRVHQMSLMTMFSGKLQMLCDTPSKYAQNKECFSFMAQTPVVWDETKGLDGTIGQNCVMARRAGKVWYVCAIADWKGASFTIPLSFLGEGSYEAEIFEDAPDADKQATHYVRKQVRTTSQETLSFKMAPGGGWVARFEQK